MAIVIPQQILWQIQPLAGQSKINPSIPRPVFCYVGGPTGRDLISGNVGNPDPGVSEASGGAVAEAQHFDSFAADTDGIGFGIGGIPVGTGDCSFFVVMKTASTRPTHETLMLTTGASNNKYHIGTRLSEVGKFQFILTDVVVIESGITNVADTWYAAGFVYKKNVNCYFSVRKDLLLGDSTIYKAEISETSSPLTGSTSVEAAIGEKGLGGGVGMAGSVAYFAAWDFALPQSLMDNLVERPLRLFNSRTDYIFIQSGALSLSSAATLRDGDKPIATQQKAVSVDALIRAADLLIGSQQKSLSVDALLADADKLSAASRHEATLAAQLLDGDVAIAPAQKAGSISGLLTDADKATGISSKAALVTGLLLDGDLLTAIGSQIETHLSAGVLSGADVLIAGVTTNRTTAGKAQDGDAITVANAIDRLSAALGIEPESLTSASTSARSIGALIVEGDVALAGIQSGRLQPALLIDGDVLIIVSSTVAQADLAGRINLTGRYAPQVSLVGVYAPAINLKGRVH